MEKGANKWAVAVAVALGALLELVDTSIVNVALSDMQASLGATLGQIGWVVSGYAIANVIILPLTAWLGVRFGKKRYFIFSLAGFTVASILCGLSTSLTMLIVARVLQGLTGGGLLAKAQSILFETFPREEQAKAQGFFGAIVIAGPAIGPTLGGYLVTNIGWRWIFFVNLPVGILAIAMVMRYLPADARSEARGRVDWIALALLAAGLGSLQTVLEEGQSEGWLESSFIVALAMTAALGLIFFVWRTLGSKEPVVDLRVLRHRSLWAGSVLSVVVGITWYGALFSVPVFAQSILHYTSQQSGLMLLPGALTSAVAMPLVARNAHRFDPRVVIAIGSGILVFGLWQLHALTPTTGGDDLFWPLIVRAAGTILVFMPLSIAALGPIPTKEIAAATGFFNLTRQLGGSVGIAMLTTVLADRHAAHRAMLGESLVASDPRVVQRVATLTQAMSARSPGHAADKALALVDGTVSLQAAVLSFGDAFIVIAFFVVVTVPLVLLLGRPAHGRAFAAGH